MSDKASEGTIFPVYFLADESGSMHGQIKDLNEGLVELVDTLAADPFAASRARISVLGFDDTVRVRADQMDCREVDKAPQLEALNGTSYRAAFDDLKGRIEPDIARLKATGVRVLRPLVFFLTDGYPNHGENWEAALEALKNPQWPAHPNIAAFGIGDAHPPTIATVATKSEWAFVADNTMAVGEALSTFMKAFTKSVVKSATAVGQGEAAGGPIEVEIEEPEGFFKITLDEM